MTAWQLWLIGGIALLVTEMVAPGFWLINVAVGCFAAGAAALLPFGAVPQVLAFAAGTVVSAVFFRPFLLRHFHSTALRTNTDALLGRTGTVIQRIESGTRTGRVNIDGEDWRGATIDGSTLEPGTRIIVLEVDGTTLKVESDEPL